MVCVVLGGLYIQLGVCIGLFGADTDTPLLGRTPAISPQLFCHSLSHSLPLSHSHFLSHSHSLTLPTNQLTQIHWNRAARTDKGVSALCQVVSAKLMVEPRDTFAERVNAHLPQQVREGGCGGGVG